MNIAELSKFRGGVSVDTISELTSASGVTVDGVLFKDSAVSAASGVSTNTITEYASGSGVTIDGILLKDNVITGDATGVKLKGGDGTAVPSGCVGERIAFGATFNVSFDNSTATNVASGTVNKGIYRIDGAFSAGINTAVGLTYVRAKILVGGVSKAIYQSPTAPNGNSQIRPQLVAPNVVISSDSTTVALEVFWAGSSGQLNVFNQDAEGLVLTRIG